jgi:hypothetical protein
MGVWSKMFRWGGERDRKPAKGCEPALYLKETTGKKWWESSKWCCLSYPLWSHYGQTSSRPRISVHERYL